VLVTGGAGFIGSHIVERLVARGDDVVVLDSLDESAHRKPPSLPDGADVRIASLLDRAAVDDAVRGVDAICHQAARVGLGVDFGDVGRYVADNDVGTATLLGALWDSGFTGRLVVASSMVVYGEGRYRCPIDGDVRPGPRQPDDLAARDFDPRCPSCHAAVSWAPIDEDAHLDPRNVYAATKLHTEHLASAYGREAGLAVCALRYHNVYGPRMPRDTPYAGVASIFRSALEAGRAPQVFEDGGQLRDFVHVDDVARANLLALDNRYFGALNVASGAPHTVLEMAEILASAKQGPRPEVTGAWRLGDVRHIVASASRAARGLGFNAEVSFEQGVADFATAPLRD
jgi:dTDP-L-rhamnose 4-epimerase